MVFMVYFLLFLRTIKSIHRFSSLDASLIYSLTILLPEQTIPRFVLNTDTTAINVKELLQQLYAKVWVEFVVRDPLWTPGTVVTSELFQSKLDEFVKQSPIFGIRNI